MRYHRNRESPIAANFRSLTTTLFKHTQSGITRVASDFQTCRRIPNWFVPSSWLTTNILVVGVKSTPDGVMSRPCRSKIFFGWNTLPTVIGTFCIKRTRTSVEGSKTIKTCDVICEKPLKLCPLIWWYNVIFTRNNHFYFFLLCGSLSFSGSENWNG